VKHIARTRPEPHVVRADRLARELAAVEARWVAAECRLVAERRKRKNVERALCLLVSRGCALRALPCRVEVGAFFREAKKPAVGQGTFDGGE
jgi:hypothetical protein